MEAMVHMAPAISNIPALGTLQKHAKFSCRHELRLELPELSLKSVAK